MDDAMNVLTSLAAIISGLLVFCFVLAISVNAMIRHSVRRELRAERDKMGGPDAEQEGGAS